MKATKGIVILAAVLVLGSLALNAGALDKNVKGELVNWTWTNKCIDEWLVPAFNKVYPNIKITTVPMAFDETHDKIFAAIAAGSGARTSPPSSATTCRSSSPRAAWST